jgi:carboxylesterase
VSDVEILPGAEPFSAPGGPSGALVLHGFTGCPQSLRGLARALASAAFAVELPRLPGHGTTLDDMAATRWSDWSAAAESAYRELSARCDRVVVAGLSMGGALALWLAIRNPEIAGVAVVNPAVDAPDPDPSQALRGRLDAGEPLLPGLAGDIADPDASELGYDRVPIACLLSLFEGLAEVGPRLAEIRCPTMILSSPQDHVVQPAQSERAAQAIAGPVERVTLERSYHVATLDYDRARIERHVVDFARRACAR